MTVALHGGTVRRCRSRSSPAAPPASGSPPPSGSRARAVRVYATVRSESSGAALVEAAGDLPLSLLVLDVDDDTSVADGIASVIRAEGRVDILVNNAGVVVRRRHRGHPDGDVPGDHEHECLGHLAVHPGGAADDAGAGLGQHRQRHLDRRTDRRRRAGCLRGVQVRDRGHERGARHRGCPVRHPGRDRRSPASWSRRSSTRRWNGRSTSSRRTSRSPSARPDSSWPDSRTRRHPTTSPT